MRSAAVHLVTESVRMRFFHPTDSGPNSGRIWVSASGAEKGLAGGTGTSVNPAVLDFDERLLDRDKGRAASWSITLAKDSVTASRLDTAADLLKQGHDIVLSVRDDALHVHYSTDNCRCARCNNQKPTSTSTRERGTA